MDGSCRLQCNGVTACSSAEFWGSVSTTVAYAQTEKQRIIWAYKILFLDVLFPLGLKKVIFLDADQVIRTDIAELWNMDLKVGRGQVSRLGLSQGLGHPRVPVDIRARAGAVTVTTRPVFLRRRAGTAHGG